MHLITNTQLTGQIVVHARYRVLVSDLKSGKEIVTVDSTLDAHMHKPTEDSEHVHAQITIDLDDIGPRLGNHVQRLISAAVLRRLGTTIQHECHRTAQDFDERDVETDPDPDPD